MIKYLTKKELMYLWIEENFKKLLSATLPETIEEKILEMPEELQADIKKDLDNMKKNPSVISDKTTEDKSNSQENIDYESVGFKDFEKVFSEMKKTWNEHEDKFIKELQAHYSKRGITIIMKK